MTTDKSVVRLVVTFLGVVAIFIVGGIVGLAVIGKPIPESLTAIGGGTIGALGALLSRTGTETQNVHVLNPPDEPVPVEPAHT